MPDKMKKIIIITFFLLFASNLYAQQFELAERDIAFSLSGTEAGFNAYNVDYPGKVPVTVLSSVRPGSRERQIVKLFAEDIFNWNFIAVRSVKVIFAEDAVELNIIPDRLIFDDIDFIPYLPAGISFYHTEYTSYDFRMLVDNFFIRMRGEYFDPVLMLERMADAVKDPVRFLSSHDPEYIINQIAAINLEGVSIKGDILILQNQLRDLAAQNNKELERLADENRLQSEELERVAAENRLQSEELERVAAENHFQSGEINKLFSENSTLRKEFENLRSSYIAELRNSLFGKRDPVPQQHIDAVLEIKMNNPAASVNEVRSAVSDKGIKLSKGKVTLIINTYLGYE